MADKWTDADTQELKAIMTCSEDQIQAQLLECARTVADDPFIRLAFLKALYIGAEKEDTADTGDGVPAIVSDASTYGILAIARQSIEIWEKHDKEKSNAADG